MHAPSLSPEQDLISPPLFVTQMKRADDEDEDEDDDAADRGKITSRNLNQAMRVGLGEDRILHVRAQNQVPGSGSASFFFSSSPESCLSRSGVRGCAEGSIVCLGSGSAIYKCPLPVVGLGHVTRIAGTMDTCAPWAWAWAWA